MTDFGERVCGRLVGDDLRLIRPPAYACGTVNSVFPHDKRHVGIITGDGHEVIVRVEK